MRLLIIVFIIIAFGVNNSFSQSSKDLIRKGNTKYKERRFEDSEIFYRKAIEKDSANTSAKYNLGNALYKQNKFLEARQKYLDVMSKDKSSDDEAKVLYNIGNTFLKEKKYAESIDYYKKALKLNPRDFDAKYNLEYARRMLLLEKQNQSKNKENQQKNTEQNSSQAKNQPDQQQNQKEQQQSQKSQVPSPALSKDNIEHILNALRNEEKKTQKEIKAKLLPRKEKRIEKNW